MSKEMMDKDNEKGVQRKDDKDKWCWTRLAEAKSKNKGNCKKLMSECIQILIESCVSIVMFICENLIGIVFLILSIVYLNDCPVSKVLPISLLVYGISSLANGISIQIVRSKCLNINDPKDGFATLTKLVFFISLFVMLFTFIIAAIAVYGSMDLVVTRNESSENYCNYFYYWFAFAFITFIIIICLVFIICFCCLICFVMAEVDTQEVQIESQTTHVVVIHETDDN
ncbi:uncharacterized protein LOC128966313 [Oppia nitens]|uniref:uncharacterized protein LOC128966313 n=1 Tax=Oppia nitens TaxID=1686743 RepID=UPI0023DC13D4|nr:uncharacterized protein LOC128966313 [Oppia nitens]